MRRTGRPAALCWLAAVAVTAAPADPVERPVSDRPVLVHFVSPAVTEAAFGDVVVEVEVFTEESLTAVFSVDGREIGRRQGPPYRMSAVLGDDFAEHRFEVTLLRDGEVVGRASRETPALLVDEAIELGLMQLYVTVEGKTATTPRLARSDFRVRDRGSPQQIVTFETGDAALTVALLLDASASMRGGRLEAAVEGARGFVRGMHDLDEAAVYLFADWPLVRTPFVQEESELMAALRGVEAAGGTAVNDALYLALRELEGRQGRRVVVVLSDGVDIHSALEIEDVLWVMRRSRSLVYWVELPEEAIATGILSPWRSAAEHRAERRGLRRLVEESGGRVVTIASTGGAEAAFRDILVELRSQYVLGYYPTIDLDDGSWHEVEVDVVRPGVRPRTRGGYVD